MALPDGTRRSLGDFEIVREIGRGGMGVVYEAPAGLAQPQVALKVLSGGLGLTATAVRRFRREAEAAARLHHTNIVPVYATGEQDGTHFYAMELIDGPSLDQVIRRHASRTPGTGAAGGRSRPSAPDGRLRLDRRPRRLREGPDPPAPSSAGLSSSSLDLGRPATSTTWPAWSPRWPTRWSTPTSNGVIHRDIKPSNLLLSPDGRLSVNDFGLARMLEQPGMTMTGEFVGTPAYMSPEQITAGRTPDGPPHRHLLAGGDALRAADAAAAVPGRAARPGAGPDHPQGAAAAAEGQPEGAGGPGDDLPEGDGEGPRPPLPDGRADGRGPAPVRQPLRHRRPPRRAGGAAAEVGAAPAGAGGGAGRSRRGRPRGRLSARTGPTGRRNGASPSSVKAPWRRRCC